MVILWLFKMIFGQEKCEAISLPACAPAALLKKVVPGPDPLKEGSSRVEPLVVRLGAVNLHLINRKHRYSPFAAGYLDNI